MSRLNREGRNVLNGTLQLRNSGDPILGRILAKVVHNISTMRREGDWLGREPDRRRDMYEECGFPKIVQSDDYQSLYDREAIATRVVEVYSKECWQVTPEVYEATPGTVDTEFEKEWNALSKGALGGAQNWYEEEEGSAVWEYLHRADILSGVGRYGCILLGLNDGRPLSEPVKGINEENSSPYGFEYNKDNEKLTVNRESKGSYNLTFNYSVMQGRKLDYLRVLPESQALITQFETNRSSRRYGHPVKYLVNFVDPRFQYGIGQPLRTQQVHWTRIVHIVDNWHTAGSNEVLAVPRMQPVLNHLYNLRKIYHPAAEGYYKQVFALLALSTHPQLGGDVEIDMDNLEDVLENVYNSLQRHIVLKGMQAQNVAPSLTDPQSHINQQIEAICIKLGIPIRIFKGSERGELASSQDDDAWNDRLKQRNKVWTTPQLIVKFINRLISVGVLSQPEKFGVRWPDLTSQSETEKAQIAMTRTQSIAAAMQGGIFDLITPFDYLTKLHKMDETEVKDLLSGAMEQMESEFSPEEDDLEGMPAPEEGASESTEEGEINPEDVFSSETSEDSDDTDNFDSTTKQKSDSEPFKNDLLVMAKGEVAL